MVTQKQQIARIIHAIELESERFQPDGWLFSPVFRGNIDAIFAIGRQVGVEVKKLRWICRLDGAYYIIYAAEPAEG